MNQLKGTVFISVTASVDEPVREAVLALDVASRATDNAEPLNDQVRLDLQHPDPSALHLLAHLPGVGIIGYAHLRHTESGVGSAHLVVAPDHRRHGVGTALVERLMQESGPAGLRVWAHGDEGAARLLSGRLEFTRVRDLWQMHRSLSEALPAPAYPDNVTVRTFRPGHDEEAWVKVNARAFAEHPEQGATSLEDLEQRMSQPWFDAAGFFLAERAARLVGFHWTKVHPAGDTAPRIGEVYVVGVDPQAQGLGLGKALTLTGLLHLRDVGLEACILYVESENTAAIGLYQRLGFRHVSTDVMYERRSER